MLRYGASALETRVPGVEFRGQGLVCLGHC